MANSINDLLGNLVSQPYKFISSYPSNLAEGWNTMVANPVSSLYNAAKNLVSGITQPKMASPVPSNVQPAKSSSGTPQDIANYYAFTGTKPPSTTTKSTNNYGGGGGGGIGGGGSQISTNMSAPQTSNSSFSDMANEVLNLTRQANQPAIQALQSSIDPLKQRYQDLINSINTQGTVAANKQTTITNNELGARGILGNSTLAQQEIQNAVLPVQAQFSGLAANAGMGEQQDINSINQQIAQLQAGSPQNAINAALQQKSYELQAQQLAAQINNQLANQAIARGQLGISGGNLALQQALAGYDPMTGKIVNPLSLLSTASGASNAGGVWQ